MDVVCIGEALVDFFAEPQGALEEARHFVRLLGGAPANVSVGLARRGVEVALVAVVGADAFGRAIRLELEREGVVVDHLAEHVARTGLAFIERRESGQPGFLFYREGMADSALGREHVRAAAPSIEGAQVLHFCGNAFAAQGAADALWEAVEIAEGAGVALSFDLNLRLHMWRREADAVEVARRLVPRATLVKASLDEARALCGEGDGLAGARALRQLGAELAIVTLGADGAFYASAAAEGHIPAVPAEVVDATGAGDAFCAALLAELLSRATPRAWGDLALDGLRPSLESACWAGARVCERLGATAGLLHTGSAHRGSADSGSADSGSADSGSADSGSARLDRAAPGEDSRVGGETKGIPMVDEQDLQRIRELARELGADVAIELVELFLQDTPNQIAVMRDVDEGGQGERLHRAAHSLKGSCANLGLKGVAALAAALEQQVRKEGLEGAETMIAQLEHHYLALVPLLSSLRDELAAGES